MWLPVRFSGSLDDTTTPRPGHPTLFDPLDIDHTERVTLVWMGLVAIGLGIAILASRRALDAASELGAAIGMSPFLIGMTIVAIGTDLPEIANSIVSSATDHGDLNMGDSVGSVVTQSTLVLGVLCLTGKLEGERRFVLTAGSLTVLSLLIGARLVSDQHLGRADSLLLIAVWITGTLIIQRPIDRIEQPRGPRGEARRLVIRTISYLGVVGVGATIAVESFTRVAEGFDVPEYALSFFVLAAGTSLPELVVDARALKRNEGALALGDLLGSSFVDATLSPAIGPLLFPVGLSEGIARGSLIAAAALTAVTAILMRETRYRWPTGLALIALYLVMFPALIA